MLIADEALVQFAFGVQNIEYSWRASNTVFRINNIILNKADELLIYFCVTIFSWWLSRIIYLLILCSWIRPLLVDCLFMVISRIWTWQSFFTAFELIITQNFGKWIKSNKKDVFNLKTPKQSLNFVKNNEIITASCIQKFSTWVTMNKLLTNNGLMGTKT